MCQRLLAVLFIIHLTGTATSFTLPPTMPSFTSSFSNLNVQDTTSEWDSTGDSTDNTTDEGWSTVSSSKPNSSPAPQPVPSSSQHQMLITIAPQCSGKTTYLSTLSPSPSNVIDITIDDQPGVYLPLPISQFLDPNLCPKKSIIGRTLKERVQSEHEQTLVLSRLLGNLDSETFSLLLSEIIPSQTLLQTLTTEIESIIESNPAPINTDKVDIFIRESIFPSAIKSSQDELKKAAESNTRIVSWGNTNARYTDYTCALETSFRTNRSVKFIKYNKELTGNLQELLKRNILRFSKTGRYIPAQAIERTVQNVESMLRECNDVEEFKVDQKLCEKAGYVLGRDRKVKKMRRRWIVRKHKPTIRFF